MLLSPTASKKEAQSGHLLSNKVLLAEIFLREPPPRAFPSWCWLGLESNSPSWNAISRVFSKKENIQQEGQDNSLWKLTEAGVRKLGRGGLSLWCRGRNVCSSQGYIWERGKNTCQSHTPEVQIDSDCLQLRPIRTSENGPSPTHLLHPSKHQVRISLEIWLGELQKADSLGVAVIREFQIQAGRLEVKQRTDIDKNPLVN